MTHTEESLMALAMQTSSAAESEFVALRLAIREVLDERDHANQAWDAAIEHANHMTGELERAEAEVERLRDALAELSVAELLDDDHPRLIAARDKAVSALKESK